MMRLLAEFTIEPFEPSNPGPHVRAAIEAAQRSASPGVSVEVGPFGTALLGPADEVLTLVEVDLPRDYGYDIPTGSRIAKRAPCSACGMSKRHIFDKVA